jgi:hypothetical protein
VFPAIKAVDNLPTQFFYRFRALFEVVTEELFLFATVVAITGDDFEFFIEHFSSFLNTRV